MPVKRPPIDTIFVNDVCAAIRRAVTGRDPETLEAPVASTALDALVLLIVQTNTIEDLCEAYDNQHSCPVCGHNCKECQCVEKRLAAAERLGVACKKLMSMYDQAAAFAAKHIDSTIHTAFGDLYQATREFQRVSDYKSNEEKQVC